MKKNLLLLLWLPVTLLAQEPTDWTYSEPGGAGNDLAYTQDYWSRHYQLLSGATPYMFSQEFNVTEGENYEFSIPIFDNGLAELKVYCEFLDAGGGDIYGETPVYSENSDKWQVISWSGTVPANAVKGYVWIKAYDETGFVSPADFYLGRPYFVANAGVNIVPDADFILDEPSGAGNDLNLVSGETPRATEGEISARYELFSTGTPYIYSGEFDVTEGASYDFSIDILDNDLAELKVYCEFLDAGGGDIYGETPQYSVNGASWQTISWSGTVPAGAVKGYVWIKCYDETGFSTSAVFHLDNATFKETGGENLVPNGGFELWHDPVKITLDAQTVTNGTGQAAVAQSNKSEGYIYLILDGESQSNLTEFDAAVTADKGAKAAVTTADTDVPISTEGLVAGMYYGYAVDGSNNISAKSENAVTVQEAAVTAVETFFVDFEEGIPIDWTIVDVNGGATWVLDNTHGLDGSKCLYNDTYPGPADDWFISPLTKMTDGYVFSLWAYGSSQYPDSLAIYVSKTGKDVEDFTVEVARFELPGDYTKFYFVLTDNANLSDGEEVYIGIHSFTEGSYTDMDEVRYGEFIFGSIFEAFTVSETEIDVIFDGPAGPSSTPAANYELRGSSTITFSTAAVDGSDDKILHLSGASANITPDFTIDSIFNTVTEEYFKMWAGISPIAYSNILYPGGSLGEDYPATFKAIVMAKNSESDGRRVWLADWDTAWCGTNAYGAGFYDEVSIGDELIILSVISPYQNQTELYYPKVMKVVSTGNALFDPFEMDGSDLDKNIADDTNPAEKYEGLLVKVMNATINSFTTPYFFATADDGTTEFRVGNGLELFDAPFNETLMDVGAIYNITGHVVNRDGDYRIVPRDASDMELVSPVSVEPVEEGKLMIRPNPVTDYVWIAAPEIITNLKIYHLTGALVKDYQMNRRNIELDISDLPANLYVVKATMNDGRVIIEKILKR